MRSAEYVAAFDGDVGGVVELNLKVSNKFENLFGLFRRSEDTVLS